MFFLHLLLLIAVHLRLFLILIVFLFLFLTNILKLPLELTNDILLIILIHKFLFLRLLPLLLNFLLLFLIFKSSTLSILVERALQSRFLLSCHFLLLWRIVYIFSFFHFLFEFLLTFLV